MSKNIPLSELVTMTYEQVHDKDCYDLFYDWFCKQESLPGKAKKLLGTLRSIVKANEKGHKFDPTKCSVFFKNNYPCYGDGRLYDSLSICENDEKGKVLFWVTTRNPYGHAEIACAGHGFPDENGNCDTERLSFDNAREMTRFFAE